MEKIQCTLKKSTCLLLLLIVFVTNATAQLEHIEKKFYDVPEKTVQYKETLCNYEVSGEMKIVLTKQFIFENDVTVYSVREMKSPDYLFTTELEYDSANRLITTLESTKSDRGEPSYEKKSYSYVTTANKTTATFHNDKYYKYCSYIENENGNIIEKHWYNKDGSLSHKKYYNDKNDLTKKMYYADDGSLESTYINTYNGKGKLVKTDYKNDRYTTEDIYEYDSNNNPTKKTSIRYEDGEETRNKVLLFDHYVENGLWLIQASAEAEGQDSLTLLIRGLIYDDDTIINPSDDAIYEFAKQAYQKIIVNKGN